MIFGDMHQNNTPGSAGCSIKKVTKPNVCPHRPGFRDQRVRMINNNYRTRTSQFNEDYNFLTYLSDMYKYILYKRSVLNESEDPIHLKKRREQLLENKARQAMQKNQVFTLFGYYPAIRYQLGMLGWVEIIDSKRRTKYDVPTRQEFTQNTIVYLDSAPLMIKNETKEKIMVQYQDRRYMSELLGERKPDLLFAGRRNLIRWNDLEEDTLVSQFPRCNFCNKLGLNGCLEGMAIFKTSNDCLKFPRGFNMVNESCVRRFIQNFRETSCFCLMKFITTCFEYDKTIHSLGGTVPLSTFDMAEQMCKRKIQSLKLENVGKHAQAAYTLTESPEETEKWLEFGRNVLGLINKSINFQYIADMKQIYMRAKTLVEEMEGCNSQHEMFEDIYNVWVSKPVANCSGHGIRIHRQLEDILKAVYPLKSGKYARFVIQKYIEKPLLIHGVKFDLRVWYLVTYMKELKIWVYHEGYVRFCSRSHSCVILDEMRHLTNVRIQRQYRNNRDPLQLPPELMWDFEQLNKYFTEVLNLPKTWDNVMKAMEESIITIMKCAVAFNYIELRKNSFQLFGADFLLHENFQPCLIEVNGGPGLSPTTSIIAKKTTALLMDIIKVVQLERMSQRPMNNTAKHPVDIGNFHLIYTKDMTPPVILQDTIMKAMTTTPVDVNEWKKLSKAKRLESERRKRYSQ